MGSIKKSSLAQNAKAAVSTALGAKKKTKATKKSPAEALSSTGQAALASIADVPTVGRALDGLAVPDAFPIEKIASIKPDSSAGVVFRLDGGFLDALRLQVRKFEREGETGTSIEFKIAGPSRRGFEAALEKLGAGPAGLKFHSAKVKKSGSSVVLKRSSKGQVIDNEFDTNAPKWAEDGTEAPLKLAGKAWSLEFVPKRGAPALSGYTRIELTGKPAEQQKAFLEVIKKAGLQQAFAPPTSNSIERYKMMKLLWTVAPKRAEALSKKPLSDLKLDTIEKALKKSGVGAARIEALDYREVAPGHFTVYDPVQVEACKKAGLAYCYSTVAKAEHVHSILSAGQKATLTRWTEGALIEGMSSMEDVGSGGAQGVFSRLVVPHSNGKRWTGRKYKIILKPEQMGRLDVWGWKDDNFGQGWGLSKDNFGARLVKSVEAEEKDSTYSGTSNEIISPVGNGPDDIAAVVATTREARDELIKHLKKQKFKPPGGASLEAFVRFEPLMRVGLLDAPLSPDEVEALEKSMHNESGYYEYDSKKALAYGQAAAKSG